MMTYRKQLAAAVLLAGTALYGLAGCGSECGPDTTEKDGKCVAEVTCGQGTQPKNGKCVVGNDGCGKNATFDEESGKCVPSDSTCTEGTTLKNGECVAAVTECGENTTNEDGVCKPDYGTICDDMGAVKPAQDGSGCIVAAGACGSGTRLASDGSCVVAEEGCGAGLTLTDDGTCAPTDEVCKDGTHFDSENGVCLPDATCKMGDKVLNGHCVSPVEKLAADDKTKTER